MSKKPDVDWEAVEREYRAGQLSVSEIGRLHGVSHTAINKRAKRDRWTRNLASKVRQEVSARLVSDEVSSCNTRKAVEDAAARGVEVIRQHRASISRGRSICSILLDELEAASLNIDEVEGAIETATKDDSNGQRRSNWLKAVSLGTRSSSISALSVAMKNLIALERQAFNLNGSDDPDASDDDHDLTVRFVSA